jgi:methionine-rich copper-binding protein CopC
VTRRAATLLALALVGLLLTPPAAGSAAGGLVGSDPAAQAVLGSAPSLVELTFSAEPMLADSHVSVLDGRGNPVSSGELTVVPGGALRQPVEIRSTGDFTIAYHAEFADGGEASGSVRFSVGTGVPPAPPDEAVREATAAALESHRHRIDPFGATLLVVDGLVGLGVLALLYLRRPYRAGPGHDSPAGSTLSAR